MKARPQLRRRGSAGFSLPELIVSMTILGVISTCVLSASLQLARFYQSAAEAADFHRRVQWADGNLRRDVRGAAAIAAGATAGEKLLLDMPDGRKIKYLLDWSSGLGCYKLVRSVDGTAESLSLSVQSWEVTLPTATDPLYLEAEVADDSRPQALKWVVLRRSITPRTP